MGINRKKLVQCPYNFALLIAVDEYPEINASLHTPIADATALREVLLKHQGYEEEEVLLIKNPTRAELGVFFDRLLLLQKQGPPEEHQGALSQAWRSALVRAREREAAGELVFPAEVRAEWDDFLDRLAHARQPENSTSPDSLLFYYAGHGLAGDLDGKGPAGYFMPTDARNDSVHLAANTSLLPMEHVFTALHAFKSHHTLLILDCCFAGTFSRINTTRATELGFRPMSEERFERYIRKRAWQVLVSAGPAEKAADFVSDRGEISSLLPDAPKSVATHSPFAEALMMALRKEEDVDVKPRGRNLGDGVITVRELSLFLHDRIERITTNSSEFEPQNPDLFPMGDHAGGQFIFCDPRHPKNEPDWSQTARDNPYKGLSQLDVVDHDYYFGRETDVALLKHGFGLPLDPTNPLEKSLLEMSTPTAEHPPKLGATVVAGASGCGKSSLVKAGLLPTFLQEGYWVLQLRPGHRPWTLELCRRYRWQKIRGSGRGSNPLRLELPDNSGKWEWIPVEQQTQEERASLVKDRFATELASCHPQEQQWLTTELVKLLADTPSGQWTLRLADSWEWEAIAQPAQQEFALMPSPAQSGKLPATFADHQVDLRQRQVLYIDQYEELFTECTEAERESLEKDLQRCFDLALEGKGHLILSIRSDFEWQLQLSDFGRHFLPIAADYYDYFRLHRLVELGLEDLRSALVNPALMLAYEFEDGLVDQILDDLDYLPNGLPLLSFTMQSMVDKTEDKEQRLFTTKTYEEKVGRVGGALAKLIEHKYEELGQKDMAEDDTLISPTPTQRLFRKLLLRMIRLSDGDYTRRRVLRRTELDELAFHENNETVEEILEVLESANLISQGGSWEQGHDPMAIDRIPYVEFIHDSLINTWPIGKQWINDFGKENLQLQRQLWQAVLDNSYGLAGPKARGGLPTYERSLQAAEATYAFSSLWDANAKLAQVIQHIADQSAFLLEIPPEEIVSMALGENQEAAEREEFLALWKKCQTKKAFPELNSFILSGYSGRLLDFLLREGNHWLNLAEVAFVKQSWTKRIEDVTRLQRERDEAEEARRNAEEALAKLGVANASTVELLLKNARVDIYHLNYEEALAKVSAAASLQAKKEEVIQLCLELAFWYLEVNDSERMETLLHLAAQLSETARAEGEKPREFIQRLVPKLSDRLHARYYPEMIAMKGGTFTMGCNKAVDAREWERLGRVFEPPHRRSISDFKMSKHLITWWQYDLFCRLENRSYQRPGWGVDGDNPALSISWFEAMDYCHWLNRRLKTKQAIQVKEVSPEQALDVDHYQVDLRAGYRLPTETEWEYAAKEGGKEEYKIYSGSNVAKKVAWWNTNSGERSHAVDSKQPNELGFYCLSGNAYEWCLDGKAAYKGNPPKNYVAPRTYNKNKMFNMSQILRGGAWNSSGGYIRITDRRSGRRAEVKSNSIGFRVVTGE